MKPVSELFVPLTYRTSGGYELKYRLYLPDNRDPDKKLPLILFLHGAGERGDNNISQLNIGICEPFKDENNPIYNCIVLCPQCPKDKKWVEVDAWTDCRYSVDAIPESGPLAAARELLRSITAEYGADTDRIYVTGLSMGGYGTWDLLARHGDIFAAAEPLCGGCDITRAGLLMNFPIRTFHGLQDSVVSPEGTAAMTETIMALGGRKIEYIPYPDLGHSIWGRAYSRTDFIPWLLEKRRFDRK